MHGKGEFFSPGKRNLAGVNTKQIMSCLLQVLPLPMPSVHLLVTILWSSTSPSPDTDVLYLLILDSLWPFTFYLKFSLPPLLFLLLFKLKDILALTQSHRSILKGHKPDTLGRGAAIIRMRIVFWFFSSRKQDLISPVFNHTKDHSFTFTKCHLFYSYFIKAQSR